MPASGRFLERVNVMKKNKIANWLASLVRVSSLTPFPLKMRVLYRWRVAEVRQVLIVGVMTVMLCACNPPHLSDFFPEKGDIRPFEQPIPVNISHKRLANGYMVTVGVKEDGTVWSWGSAINGGLGNGMKYDTRHTPEPIKGMTDFIEVAGDGQSFLALRRDGTVWSWGDNEDGQLGYMTEKWYSAVPRQVLGLNNIVSIAVGNNSALALDESGKLFFFGVNEKWGFNVHKSRKDLFINKPAFLLQQQGALKVVMRGVDVALMSNSGQVWICCERVGDNLKVRELPYKIADVAFSLNATYYLLSNGLVMADGQNTSGELGQGDYKKYVGPVQVKNIGRIKSIAANGLSGIALDEMGRIWQWGYNVRFPVVAGLRHNIEPLPVLVGVFRDALEVESGSANAVLIQNGDVYFWGWNRGGERGTGKESPKSQMNSKNWFVPERSRWTWK